MKKFNPFVSNTPRNTLFVLFSGCLLIVVCSIFVISVMWRILDHAPRYQKNAFQILGLYQLINTAPQHVKSLDKSSFPYQRIKVTQAPAPAAQPMQQPNAIKLIAWQKQHPRGGGLALQLNSGQWLNLDIKLLPEPFWMPFIGFTLLAALLLFSLFILCMWTVNRLYQPLSNLSRTISHLGPEENILVSTNNREVDRIIAVFNNLQVRINRLLRSRTQMLAAIAHDLRTPITRLKLRIEYFPDHAQYEKAMADLVEMEEMINSTLVFARQENVKGPSEEFDLNALLESLANDFSDIGLPVAYQGFEKTIPFYGSIIALKRAFTNFIDNAIKYGKTANVSLNHDAKFIYIQIDDQGPGIPAEQLEHVFEPFYRIEQSRSKQTGGVGLGLTIARDIIVAHQGDVRLLNKQPVGLRVTVTLPRYLK